VQRRDVGIHQPEGSSHACHFAKQADTKSSRIITLISKIDVLTIIEIGFLAVIQYFEDQAFQFLVSEVPVFDGGEVTQVAQQGRHADGKVNVGTALFAAELQEGVNSGH